jgi:hypothetical protein
MLEAPSKIPTIATRVVTTGVWRLRRMFRRVGRRVVRQRLCGASIIDELQGW